MDTLSAEEAAQLLHLNVKRVQALARSGKLPAARIGRKWLFARRELEQMLSETRGGASGSIQVSARNQLSGRITALKADGVMAEVVVQIGEQELVAIITRASAERMRLAVGDLVLAVIKSTEIMIGKAGS
jgi:molybdopterin-binding protein